MQVFDRINHLDEIIGKLLWYIPYINLQTAEELFAALNLNTKNLNTKNTVISSSTLISKFTAYQTFQKFFAYANLTKINL